MGIIISFPGVSAFSPEIVSAVSDAYDQANGTIRAHVGEAVADEVVARRVIELAKRGVTDAAQLRNAVLEEFSPARMRHTQP